MHFWAKTSNVNKLVCSGEKLATAVTTICSPAKTWRSTLAAAMHYTQRTACRCPAGMKRIRVHHLRRTKVDAQLPLSRRLNTKFGRKKNSTYHTFLEGCPTRKAPPGSPNSEAGCHFPLREVDAHPPLNKTTKQGNSPVSGCRTEAKRV